MLGRLQARVWGCCRATGPLGGMAPPLQASIGSLSAQQSLRADICDAASQKMRGKERLQALMWGCYCSTAPLGGTAPLLHICLVLGMKSLASCFNACGWATLAQRCGDLLAQGPTQTPGASQVIT